MKIKRYYNILVFGMMISLFLVFLASLFQVLVFQNTPRVLWFFLFLDVLIWLYKLEFDKVKDESRLEWVEQFFLVANLIVVLLALGAIGVTFSKYWLAKDMKYLGLAFGFPSLIAIMYWYVIKNNKDGAS